MNNGLINLNVQTLAIDSVDTEIIYAGTDAGSLFISMDGGANWSAITGSISGANVLSLAVDPDTTTTLYAGTAGEGFFKLTERGEPSATEGSGGGCFISSTTYGSPVSWQGQAVATILVVFISIMIVTIALLYLLKKLRLHGLVFERRFSHGMPILRKS